MKVLWIVALFGMSALAKEKWVPAAVANYPLTGTVTWTGTGVGKSHTGTLNIKSGTAQMQGEEVISASFVVDMNSLTNENKKLEGHLKSPDFFDVAKFPESKFILTSAKRTAPGQYDVTGTLSIRDKAQVVKFPAAITLSGSQVTAKGSYTIPDRTVYGIQYNSKKFFDLSTLKDKVINDEITLAMDLRSVGKK